MAKIKPPRQTHVCRQPRGAAVNMTSNLSARYAMAGLSIKGFIETTRVAARAKFGCPRGVVEAADLEISA